MQIKSFLTVLTVAVLGMSAQAITINFQSNGTSQSLGSSSVFSFTGGSLTAYASSGISMNNLYAKSAGGDETGLGLTSDPTGDHEISGSFYIQLLASSGAAISSVSIGSATSPDVAQVYVSTALGSLGTFLASTNADGTISIPAQYQTGYYINIASGGGNVLLDSATVGSVPDGGSTLVLLGSSLAAIGLIRRKLQA